MWLKASRLLECRGPSLAATAVRDNVSNNVFTRKEGRDVLLVLVFFFCLPTTTDSNDNSRSILQGPGDLLGRVRLPLVMAGDCRSSPARAASSGDVGPSSSPCCPSQGLCGLRGSSQGHPPAAFPFQLESKILWVLMALTIGQCLIEEVRRAQI